MRIMQIKLRRVSLAAAAEDGSVGRSSRARRRGSTLLIVIALTGMLALLGVMFFSFASQEMENARNFNRAAARLENPEHPAKVYFDFALQQIIQGSDPNQKNSALYGPRHSIIGSLFGHDSHPFNGQGVTLMHFVNTATTFEPLVYQNGIPQSVPFKPDTNNWWDDPQVLLGFNDSPAANYDPDAADPTIKAERNLASLPAPDVDYTYPDLNNVFLAYRGYTRTQYNEDVNNNGTLDPGEDLNGNGTLEVNVLKLQLVIKPSYHRPEVLAAIETSSSEDTNNNGILDVGEDTNGNGMLDIEDFDGDGMPAKEDVNGAGGLEVNEDTNGNGILDGSEDANGNGVLDVEDFNANGTNDDLLVRDPHWAYNAWTKNRVMRAHPGHIAYVIDPQTRLAVPTEIRRFLDDDTTDPGDLAIIAGLPGGSGGFKFRVDLDSDGIVNEQGVWSFGRPRAGQDFQYEYDVDNDNDGERDGVLIDLSYRPEQRPSDGALYVPMFSATIYDAAGLFNLNMHGNLSGDTREPAVTGSGTFGDNASVSRSLHGLAPSEINLIWGLIGHVGQEIDASSLTDYSTYFNRIPPAVDVAMDSGLESLRKRIELANMALWWLNKGRVEFGAAAQIHTGRLGEEDRMWQVYFDAGKSNLIAQNAAGTYQKFPFPGYWSADDNNDFNSGGAFAPAGIRSFGHPISFSGRGSFTVDKKPQEPRLTRHPGRPVQWPAYDGLGLAGDVTWRSMRTEDKNLNGALDAGEDLNGNGILDSGLTTNLGFGVLGSANQSFPADDMMEITLEELRQGSRWSVSSDTDSAGRGGRRNDNELSQRQTYDETFSLDDSAVLQLSGADVVNAGVTSRLTKLLPSHVDPANNTRAIDIRKMFTTHSWDRRQYGLSQIVGGPGADTEPGVRFVDDNQDGVVDNPQELGWPGSDDDRAWEFNVDVDNDTLLEFPPQFGEDRNRNGTLDPGEDTIINNGTLDGVAAYAGYAGLDRLPTLPQDPFRAEVRQLLNVERGNQDSSQRGFQFRLSINHLLDSIRPADSGRPIAIEFRALTPHPTSGVTDVPDIAVGAVMPSYPPQNSTQQEWWARYDRQRMARDIYVLLYTLCGGDNTQNTLLPNTGASRSYSAGEMRQMAQFAVNVVDSVDRDDARTMFEYDTNLFDGWGLDDQAWDSTRDTAGAQRTVVYGVEEQQLAFSEALWVYQKEISANHDATAFDDSDGDHHFLYMELQNVSPRATSLTAPSGSTSAGTAVWRIRRKFAVSSGSDPRIHSLGAVELARAVPSIPQGEEALYFQNGAGRVAAGDMYSIGTCDRYAPGSTHVSTFYFDDNLDLTFEAIIPRSGSSITAAGAGMAPTLPTAANAALSLDMTYTAPSGSAPYNLVNFPGRVGGFLDAANAPAIGSPAADQLVLVLERRLNPELNSLSLTENPWVTVDVMYVPKRDLALQQPDTATELPDRINNLTSVERPEPLAAGLQAAHGAPGRYSNTIHNNPVAGDGLNWQTTNSTPTRNPFTNYQKHLNREFTSPAELFAIPLRGPKTLAFAIESMERAPHIQQRAILLAPEFDEDQDGDRSLDSGEDLNGDGTIDYDEDLNGNGQLDTHEDTDNNFRRDGGEDKNFDGILDTWAGPVSAGGKLLQSAHPLATADPQFDNHWHRLLGFFEVPTRTHRQLSPDTLLLTRLPAKINLNTVRHPEVMGGMIDDLEIATPPERDINGINGLEPFEDFNGNSSLDSGLRDPSEAGRDHWFDLLQSRDGFDPVSYLVLPGTSSSRPFRDLSNLTSGLASVQNTILRTHPRAGVAPVSNRRLFELGTDTESNSGAVDSHARYRLLSKLMNNATTRSNVFFVYLTVQFHEAHEDSLTGAVRIGGRFDLDGDGDPANDGHRGFFIIDRSDIERAFQDNTFKWQDVVKYELTIN